METRIFQTDRTKRVWTSLTCQQRCRLIGSVAGQLAAATDELIDLCASDQRVDPVETVASEILPLCSALRLIGRRGATILAPRRHGISGRPAWLVGLHSVVRREPFGLVLILGTWNYPLLLPGTQVASALAAGNRVLLKPAAGSEAATSRMVKAFHDAGVPTDALMQLDSSTQSAIAAMDAGVDLIVLTGSAATGRHVLAKAAQTLTPAIVELSGCDAVVVMPGADIERAADAIVFGLTFNSGATCIGPRRLIVTGDDAKRLKEALLQRLSDCEPSIVHPSARAATADAIEESLSLGCADVTGKFDARRLRTSGQMAATVLDNVETRHPIASADVFAPLTSIMRIDDIDDAVAIVNDCPYRLAASVFGPRRAALSMARKLSVGSVAINDLMVPTADPRLPFGGRGQSGFGVTRGVEGLLAMTVPQVISERRGNWMPHLKARTASDINLLAGAAGLLHGRGIGTRMAALRRILGGGMR